MRFNIGLVQPNYFLCRAVRSTGGYRSAVEHLKLHEPSLFTNLNESTVRGWFVQGSYTDLNEKTRKSLRRGKAFFKPSSSGRKPTLENFPNIRQELVETLQALRDSGDNVYVICCLSPRTHSLTPPPHRNCAQFV